MSYYIAKAKKRFKELLLSKRFLPSFINILISIKNNLLAKYYRKSFIEQVKGIQRSKIVKEIVNFALHSNKYFLKTSQVKSEISALIDILNEIKPRFILEIGTMGGGTLFLFSQIASDDATIISIDLQGGIHGGGYPSWKIPIYRSFISPTQKVSLIRGDSHKINTYHQVKKILKSNLLDFLYLDGDHVYEGVKKDFEFYSRLVKKGGIIAFHDIVKHPPEINVHVDRYWNQIKNKYKYEEIVENWDQKWGGIGIIYI